MKIVNLKPNEFDELVKGEPDNSYSQSSYWAKYKSEYEPLYIGYANDNNIYSALALILVEKNVKRNKKAYCHNGFLINYYDTELLNSFTIELKKYLKKYKIGELTIAPFVKYETKRGNNDLLIKRIQELGYKKINDRIIYSNETIVPSSAPTTIEDVVLDTYIVETDEQRKVLFADNKECAQLYATLKEDIDFITCAINLEKTKANLNAYINETPHYIEIHEDDYEYDQLIIERKEITKQKQELLDYVSKIDNPIFATTAFLGFNGRVIQLFIHNKEKYQKFNALDFINYKTMETLHELQCNSYHSYTASEKSVKIPLIGEFSLKI